MSFFFLSKCCLVSQDASTRIHTLALTTENAEIHNYQRLIGGVRQVNLDSYTGDVSVLNNRFNGKPTERKKRSVIYRLRPNFISLPGKVAVFPRKPYAFRKNQKAAYQVVIFF
jgi:hypothetical protein